MFSLNLDFSYLWWVGLVSSIRLGTAHRHQHIISSSASSPVTINILIPSNQTNNVKGIIGKTNFDDLGLELRDFQFTVPKEVSRE